MLAPIRPSPIIPSCIGQAWHGCGNSVRRCAGPTATSPAPRQPTRVCSPCSTPSPSTRPAPAGCRAGPSATCSRTSPATPTASCGCSESAERGEVVDRYEGGGDGRDADIEAGHDRSAARAGGRRAPNRRRDWRRRGPRTRTGTGSAGSGRAGRCRWPISPFARWREVEVHRVDLGLGYEPEDWPAEYVRLELREMEMRWNARRPMGLTGLPPAALAAAASDAPGLAARPNRGRWARRGRHHVSTGRARQSSSW